MHYQVKLHHGNRTQSLRSCTLDGATATWSPPANTSLALTLFGEDTHPNKKNWELALFAKVDNEEKLVAKTVINVAEKLDCNEKETFELLSAGSGWPKAVLKAHVRTEVESRDGGEKKKSLANKFKKIVPSSSKNSCVLMLGITGAGKTSVANVYTGNAFPTGSDARSVTEEIQMMELTYTRRS